MIKKATYKLLASLMLLMSARLTTCSFDEGGTAPAKVPRDGLVAEWLFSANMNDTSGNGNNGTAHGTTFTTDRFGRSNSACSFDGLSDYIATSYSGILGDSARTVSLWLTTATGGRPMYALSYGGYAGERGNSFRCGLNNSQSMTGVDADVSNGDVLYSASTSDSSTHHYVYMVPDMANPSLADVRVYMDGKLLTAAYHTNGLAWDQQTFINTVELQKVYLGDYYDTQNSLHFYFSGTIDDVRIYNRALSEDEVQALYHEGQ